jgi:hypothetical protein
MCINFYLRVDEWIYLIARVGAGSRSFRGVQAVVAKCKKSPPSLLRRGPSACLRVAKVYCSVLSVSGDFGAKWKGSKTPTPDIHTTVIAKRVESPVGIQGQQDMRVLVEGRNGNVY